MSKQHNNYYQPLRDLEDSYFPDKKPDNSKTFEGRSLQDEINSCKFDFSKAHYPLIPCHKKTITFELPPANDKEEIIIEIELCGL